MIQLFTWHSFMPIPVHYNSQMINVKKHILKVKSLCDHPEIYKPFLIIVTLRWVNMKLIMKMKLIMIMLRLIMMTKLINDYEDEKQMAIKIWAFLINATLNRMILRRQKYDGDEYENHPCRRYLIEIMSLFTVWYNSSAGFQ